MQFGQPNRRDVLALLGSATAVWPSATAAQTERTRRVGVLMNYAATQAEGQASINAFIQGLRQLGWMEGQNLRLDIRWNAGDLGLAKIYAAQLIGLMPDVILASSTPNLNVIRQATNAIPIVFTGVSDPVEQGLVPSLTRPGGNITGFSNYEYAIGGKWLGLLKEAAPGLARVAVMFSPDTSPQSRFFMRAIETAAASLAVTATAFPVRSAADIEIGLGSFAREPDGGLILPTDAFTRLNFQLIAELTLRYRLPSIAPSAEFTSSGGLISYQADLLEPYRVAAGYVDRILKGEKPADLPIQLSSKFRLVINLKVAKALGLSLPPSLLFVADEVIE
jgi:putative ABC transport system substrate-binding protein